ncbi:MAG: lipoyl synthase [Candidatus Zixiibacteriota bacterium]|nr:MAG: lipoyl synthase [candidate division Zixibacteria bacterium]
MTRENTGRPGRKPEWLRVRAFSGDRFDRVSRLLRQHDLNTVCQAANCPNRGECFNRGTATFLILGPQCTRRCTFCDVKPGQPAPPDPDEPRRVAEVARELDLRHVVVTSVTRDDLPDGGAAQFAEVVRLIRQYLKDATVEILTPDFKSSPEARETILNCAPDVFNHNVETVPRLYPAVRPQADYHCSLNLLAYVAEHSDIVTKSGLMVGLGESFDELTQVFTDLADSGVSILTIGQYLAPSKDHFPVQRYYHPDEFAGLKKAALAAGMKKVHSAPLVRSSYKADLL